jgi:hypothetical protein
VYTVSYLTTRTSDRESFHNRGHIWPITFVFFEEYHFQLVVKISVKNFKTTSNQQFTEKTEKSLSFLRYDKKQILFSKRDASLIL